MLKKLDGRASCCVLYYRYLGDQPLDFAEGMLHTTTTTTVLVRRSQEEQAIALSWTNTASSPRSHAAASRDSSLLYSIGGR
jgi:hypothetical protein